MKRDLSLHQPRANQSKHWMEAGEGQTPPVGKQGGEKDVIGQDEQAWHFNVTPAGQRTSDRHSGNDLHAKQTSYEVDPFQNTPESPVPVAESVLDWLALSF